MQQMVDPQQLAMSSELGALKAKYKPSISNLIIAFGALLFGIIMLGGFSLAIIDVLRRFHTASQLFSLIFLIMPIIPLGIAVRLFRKHLRDRKLCVYVHEHGFVYVGREKGRTETRVIRWNQIAFIWHRVTRSTTNTIATQGGVSTTSTSYTHTYYLQCQDGSRLVLDNTFPKLRELGKIIELESAFYQMPAAQNVFNAGQPVVFGELQADRSGITRIHSEQLIQAAHNQEWAFKLFHMEQPTPVPVKQLPWQEVARIEINENTGNITIYERVNINKDIDMNILGIKKSAHIRTQETPWTYLSTGSIPNIEVFKSLTSSYVRI